MGRTCGGPSPHVQEDGPHVRPTRAFIPVAKLRIPLFPARAAFIKANIRCFYVSRSKLSYLGRQKSTFLQHPRLSVKRGAPSEKAGKKPAAKKGKAAKDPNKPKRPASAFFVFMEEFRKTYKEKHPNNKSVAAVSVFTSFVLQISDLWILFKLVRLEEINGNLCQKLRKLPTLQRQRKGRPNTIKLLKLITRKWLRVQLMKKSLTSRGRRSTDEDDEDDESGEEEDDDE
ncbi:hypothetical protein HYC85_005283 [Camellia sinensis]|uniref:HMG box domain-containing protein n=1 Tax=Camellia sinensis TaxID=4442 RepID=A0A7J7I1T2_CAMSI|nr:hypothetical protein HYC85_005283 [Camellia sinensis]